MNNRKFLRILTRALPVLVLALLCLAVALFADGRYTFSFLQEEGSLLPSFSSPLGDEGDAAKRLARFVHHLQLLGVHMVKVLHEGNVVLHLSEIAHAGESHQHTVQIRREANAPGGGRALRLGFFQDLLRKS